MMMLHLLRLDLSCTMQPAICATQGFAVIVTNVSAVLVRQAHRMASLIMIISCFSDFDTCSSCFTITNEQHPGHGFVKVANTGDLMVRS